MLSNKPYLLRAFYQWIVDSNCNPILVIDANYPRVKVPEEYVEGGEIVFNISPAAVRDLKMLNEFIEFKASFSGVIHIISAPVKAVMAIYAEENGEGIFFDAEEDDDNANPISNVSHLKEMDGSHQPSGDGTKTNKSKPFLKLVE